jgi:hypothetical protein
VVVTDAPAPTARAARIITEVLAPWVVVLALPLAIGLRFAHPLVRAVGLGLLAGVVTALLPMAYIMWALKRGRVTDHHVGRREQRLVPLLVGGLCVVAGMAVLVLAGAPRPMIAVSAAEFAGLAVAVPVSLRWKISLHAMVAAGAAAMLVLAIGPAMLVLAAPVAAVCWSRVRLRDHTLAQVLVGSAVGVVVSGSVYALLS